MKFCGFNWDTGEYSELLKFLKSEKGKAGAFVGAGAGRNKSQRKDKQQIETVLEQIIILMLYLQKWIVMAILKKVL